MKIKILLFGAVALCVFAAFTWQGTAAKSGTICYTCDGLSGLEKIVCLADDFKASLTSTQISTLELGYNLTNAAKWSNLPVTLASRIGIRFGDLSADQLVKAKNLIAAAMGKGANEGYDEAQQLWAADQYLSQNGGGSTYGSGQYYMAFLGTPSTTTAWELQTGGHHFAVANTYGGGVMTGATPSFRAVEPFAAFQSGTNTYQPLLQERDALAAVLASLTSAQLTTAKLGTTYNDITLGPGKDWQFPTTKSGIKCNLLSVAQKEKVIAAIRTYVEDIDSVNAAAYMALYTAQLDDTYISYANTTALAAQKDYIRIDGPRVWIEYSVQNGIVLSPTHPHSVWRDHQSDYGGLGNPNVATNNLQAFDGKYAIFPNPSTGNSQVQVELDHPAAIRISIYDAMGKQVGSDLAYNVTAGSHYFPIDLKGVPAAVYNCILTVKNAADGTVSRASRQLSKI